MANSRDDDRDPVAALPAARRSSSVARRLLAAYALGLAAIGVPLELVHDRGRGAVTLALLGGLIAGVAAAWILGRRLSSSLDRMTNAATEIATGDDSARLPEGGSAETVALARAVNRVVADLRARVSDARSDRETRDLVLAAMDEGVVLMDSSGEPQYANPAAFRLLGRMAAEHIPRARPPGDRPYVLPVLRRLSSLASDAGTVREEEIEIGRPARIVLASAFPVGAVGLVLMVLRDVTDARRTDAIRRDFVAAASHELKTPVASIQAAAETLVHALDEDPEASRRFVGLLLRDAERLSRIVMDLLDLSRLESERAAVEPVRLDELAKEEVERMSERSSQAGLTVVVDAMPVLVRGSRKDLALLLSNLLDNAIRYTRSGGRVSVEVSGSNGKARLEVSDTGMGIPARELPRIFERFYRVDRARSRETGGTGLGLAIVRHVAEQHGGRVEARSELGRGSNFVVTLPSSD